MSPLVDLHLQFYAIPALAKLNSPEPDEELSSYESTFKIFLDKKFPKRTIDENRSLYTEYITRLASEIATRVFHILNERLVFSGDYCDCFQKKFTSVFNAFKAKDGCELAKDEVDPILMSVVKKPLTMQTQVHKAIECHVTAFLAPYKRELILPGDEKALNRRELSFWLEMQLGFQFNPVPCTARHRKAYAMQFYLFECANYIMDQYEKTGPMPSYEESLNDERYKKIFRGCLEAVLEATYIDFPKMYLSSREIRECLHQFIKLSPRMNPS